MKQTLTIFLILIICSSVITACGENKDEQIKALQYQNQLLQNQFQIEQKKADDIQSHFNLLIGLSLAFAVFALIVGINMGSKARKDFNRSDNNYKDARQ